MTGVGALARFPDARWLRLEPPLRFLRAVSAAEVPELLAEIDGLCRERNAAVGFVTYEAAPAFDSALPARPYQGPYAVFAVADRWRWLPESKLDLRGGVQEVAWGPEIDRAQYLAAGHRILEGIRAGDFYQVNYTFRVRGASLDEGPFDAWTLFANLQRAQRGAYSVFLDDGELAVCSASPELFFSLRGDEITSKPMKGTAKRGLDLASDREQLARLRASEKERAENLMIVDMVRNDLSRIALPGTVQVDELFATQTFPTVHQMTSTVRARTRAPLRDLFAALFPAASITGAPKSSSMRAIRELEISPRGVYTGAVGTVLPGRRMQWSVAIRTAVLERLDSEAQRLEYGTGSGIVADSLPASEWAECETKASNLYHRLPRFRLLETMRLGPPGYWLLEGHLQRLRESAQYFGFAYREGRVRARLQRLADELKEEGSARRTHRVRLLLSRSGRLHLEHHSIEVLPRAQWNVAVAETPVSSQDRFLRHKTTYRGTYRRALEQVQELNPGADEALLLNERGELTEGTVSNLAVELPIDAGKRRHRWFTPPVSSGLLNGVLRRELVARDWLAERVLDRRDLAAARSVVLMNSVRGLIRARLIDATSD